MSTVYGKSTLTGPGNTPNRVNFGWLGESWKLFTENASLWISAILLTYFAPVIFDGVILGLTGFVHTHLGAHFHNLAGLIKELPRPVVAGLLLMNLVFFGFMFASICRMAVRQVAGETLTTRDIFGGAPFFGSMLLFCIIYGVLVSAGTIMVLIPGLILAGLLLPGFAMLADGHTIGDVFGTGLRAVAPDKWMAAGLVFVFGILISVSAAPLGFGLLITMPMFVLVSALAYRDLIGYPSATEDYGSIDAILGIEETHQAVSLTGEDDDNGESGNRH